MLKTFVCISLGLRRYVCECLFFWRVTVLKLKKYFSTLEIVLWTCSVITIVVAFCFFDRENFLTLCASLIGVTSLIFSAKGNPLGQLLMVVFSIFYGIIIDSGGTINV